jgi:hypothetical protein
MTQSQANKRQRLRDLESKKYHCQTCDKSFRDRTVLNKHLTSMIHNPERYVRHTCLVCMYSTRVKANLRKHKTSQRHINKEREQAESPIQSASA